MGVADELKKTNKGQLQYSRAFDNDVVQRLTEEVSAPPKLFIYHQESPTQKEAKIVKSLQPPSEEKCDESKEQAKRLEQSKSLTNLIAKNEDGKERADIKTSCYRSAPVSPEYGRTCLQIRNFEVMCDNKAKSSVEAKILEFEQNDRALQTMVDRKAVDLEKQQQLEMRKLLEQTSRLQLREKAETSKRIQEMKDSHRTRKKLQDDKLREGERKKKQLEEERKRNELQRFQISAKQYFAEICEVHDKVMSAYENCSYKQHIPEAGLKPKQVINQIMVKAQTIVKKAELSAEDVQGIESLLEYAKNSFDFMQAHLVEASKKGKAEEEAAKQQQALQEQQKAAALQEQAAKATESASQEKPAPTEPKSANRQLNVIDEVVTEYEQFKAKLDDTKKMLSAFTSNTQTKKYRFELQKAINTPINAISPVDGANLRDKLQKLIHVLGGHKIEGKHVSAKDSPEGLTFCKNIVAKMFVKKGEEQVSSKHESAFAIAMVAVGLWYEHGDLGDLMLSYFHDFCPYIIPIYLPKDDKMTSQQYHRLLGYKVDEDDGSIEPQDKFLKRMSGIMRLYGAILVSSPPRANCVHPHGIEHAWIWFARVINMDPQPDITATLTYDMLQVTGHALYSAYKIQFVKLLFMLYKEFMPKLKAVSVAGGPVARLELFIEQTLKNFQMKQMMKPPEGYLPQSFWFT